VRVRRRTDPQRLTQFALDHPLVAAAVSGLLVAAWGVVLELPMGVAVASGLAMTLIVWFIWREGGPGYRWRQALLRRFPKRRP
jgi:hypothetical protein